MRVNVSAVKTFLNDQLDWYFAYHLRRVPKTPAIPLAIGTIWHTLMEYYARTRSRDDAKRMAQLDVNEAVQEARVDLATPEDWIDDFQKQVEHIFNLFDHYEDPVRGEDGVLLIEEPIEMPLGNSNHILFGRPDRVIRYQGKLWHVQNRTLSDRTPIPVYLAAAERDLHELAYAALICHKYNEARWNYGGTLMNIVRKISKKKLVENPREAFVQEFVPISDTQITVALGDICRCADQMASIAAGEFLPTQNRDTDKGRFGNKLSPYFEVKMGRADIRDDNLFKTARDRYEIELAHDSP